MSTTATRLRTGDLVVITHEELHGRTATILCPARTAGSYVVKVIDGPALVVSGDELQDAAEYWERS